MDYDIIMAETRTGLVNQVKKYLAEGWRLCGGLAVAFKDRTEVYYYQTMTKEEDKPEE